MSNARLSDPRLREATQFARAILPSVSRTFALSIRVLPGELGSAVRTAYLLCRTADTIEDDPQLSAARKAHLLGELLTCFDDATAADAFAAHATELRGDPAHVMLLARADLVFVAYRALSAEGRAVLKRWITEMIQGMRKFAIAYPDGIRVQTLDEFREYCYYVAGTVGHLLTDLWHEYSSAIGEAEYRRLVPHSRAFGEALQTVNILKDLARDATDQNTIYLPEQLLVVQGATHATMLATEQQRASAAAAAALADLAAADLEEAKAYLLAIPRRAITIRLFCVLPLLFAYATLREVTRRRPFGTRDAKISRREVRVLATLALVGVASNRATAWLINRVRRQRIRESMA